MGLFRYIYKRQLEEEIPKKKYYSTPKQPVKQEVVNSKYIDPRFQQLMEDLNALKSDFTKFSYIYFFYKLLHTFW